VGVAKGVKIAPRSPELREWKEREAGWLTEGDLKLGGGKMSAIFTSLRDFSSSSPPLPRAQLPGMGDGGQPRAHHSREGRRRGAAR